MSRGAHKVAKIEACIVKRNFSPVFWHAPPPKCVWGDLIRAPLIRVRLNCTGTFKVSAPPRRHLASSWGCTLQFGTNLIMSWYRCRTLRLSEKNLKDPQHIPTIIYKRGGIWRGYWVWLGWDTNGAKIEVSGWELDAKICTWIGRGSRIEICVRIIWQVKMVSMIINQFGWYKS